MGAGAKMFAEAGAVEMDTTTASEPSSPKSVEHDKTIPISEAAENDCDKDSDSKSEQQMKNFVDMLKKLKLNPLAKEFIPSFNAYGQMGAYGFVITHKSLGNDGFQNNRKKQNYSSSRKRTSSRASKAQREDSIRKTVYVSDLDHNITEERLAAVFSNYGQVVDCRVCGDAHSRLHFAFVEFDSAKAALNLSGSLLGLYTIKVMPSKTAILPVNPTFLPKSEDEREMCTRTVYCTNIDKKVIQADVKSFFETKCGLVCKENQTKKLHKACLKMYDVITLVVGFWGITHTPPELHLWNSTWLRVQSYPLIAAGRYWGRNASG